MDHLRTRFKNKIVLENVFHTSIIFINIKKLYIIKSNFSEYKIYINRTIEISLIFGNIKLPI